MLDPPDLLLICSVARRLVALPVTAVERILRMVSVTPLSGAPAHVLGVVDVRGVLLPVVNPRPLLGLPAAEFALDQHLVVLSGERRFALWIDRAEQVSHVPQTQLEAVDASPIVRLARFGGVVIEVFSPKSLDPGPLSALRPIQR